MSASSSQRPYQGYPYVNPNVVDAPSIDSATAARWANLPRRPIQMPASKVKDNPAVHINVPEDGTNEIQNTKTSKSVPNRPSLPPKKEPEDDPVIYIDLPEETNNEIRNDDTSDSDDYEDSETEDRPQNISRPALPVKKEPDDAPVVYIDMPVQNGSVVAQNREEIEEDNEPTFDQETIFFDPFENRRIDVVKDEELPRVHGRLEPESDEDSVSNRSVTSTIRTLRRPAPPRPNSLNLNSAGTSASSMSQPGTSTSTSTPRLPSIMSKEALIYGRQTTQDDGFPLSPIPVSEFPEPPPAYTEFESVRSPQPTVVEQPVREPDPIPPRTQVILPRETISTPIGMPNLDRKYLNCHFCAMRVHTLVIRENGYITHIVAAICFFFAMFPLVCLIYCTDYLKVKNHYCPMCSKVIGYELPFSDGKIYYVN